MTDQGPEIAGRVTIEWPNAERCAGGPLQSWRTVVRDADTGTGLELPVLAVTVSTVGRTVVADIYHPDNPDGEWRDPADGAVKVLRYEVMRMTEGPGRDTLTEVSPYVPGYWADRIGAEG